MATTWQLPGYAVEQLIGFGRHGDVWRARDLTTGETVALKRLPGLDPAVRDRLRRDAAVVGSFAPDHVVGVRDVVGYGGAGDEPAGVVIVADHAAGGSLAEVLARRGRLAAPEVVTLLAPLAETLAGLHARGLVHGRITPANVLFTADGRPLLGDVGLAAALGVAGAPADDVRDLAVLGRQALGGGGAEGEPPPTGLPPALLQALTAAGYDDPAVRPNAGAFAAAVLGSAPAAPIGLTGRAAVAAPRVGVEPTTAPTRTRARRPHRPRRDRRPRPWRPMALVAAVAVAVVAGTAWGRHAPGTGATLPPSVVGGTPWRDVVARLDALRAAAFRAADPQLLTAVYVPGAEPLAEDLATVRSLAARGLRARGFDAAVREVVAVAADARSATLRVVDSLTAYDLVDPTGRLVGHGAARPPRHLVLVLARVGASWRVRAVRPA